jgi:hypothetical protein
MSEAVTLNDGRRIYSSRNDACGGMSSGRATVSLEAFILYHRVAKIEPMYIYMYSVETLPPRVRIFRIIDRTKLIPRSCAGLK